MPARIIYYELGECLPDTLTLNKTYDSIWLIVCLRGRPIGQVLVDNCRQVISADQMRSAIVYWLHERLSDLPALRSDTPPDQPELAELLPELQPIAGQRHFLSIVVCTRDRPDDLRLCLQHLTMLTSERHQLEIVVVDNNPDSGQTAAVTSDFPTVRYVTEHAPGVAHARNAGLRAARGDIVAYIDDDVVVPADWPRRILAPFADPRVMCVSGLVLPLELEHASQERFEQYGGLGRGYVPRIFGPDFFYGRSHVVHTWDLGGTANVAIRKSVIAHSGMFDETLGPGQPSGVGEDIYMFYRILKARFLCYYEPAAYVMHKHRRDDAALERQLYNYSKGQVSYQLRTLISDGDWRVVRQLFHVLPRWYITRFYRKLRGQYDYPTRLIWAEMRGNVMGLYAFPQSIRRHQQLHGWGANPIKPVDPDSISQDA